MANSRKLIVEVVGDTSKLDRSLKKATNTTTKFGQSLDGLNAGRSAKGLAGLSTLAKSGAIAVGLGIATQKAVQFSEAASDLNEQVTKSQAVFGGSSKEIQRWADTTASSIGISKTAALEASGTFGNLFSTVGIVGDQAAEMSKRLVQIAADLASFNNADPSDTLDAIRSGLIGEAEPLRRFGVLLSEARVQQRAMADTGKDTAKSLTNQEKALARFEIILGDTGKAQGDFARTSEGLANKQRILKARLADTEAEIGTKLLPIQIRLTDALLDGIDAAERFAGALDKIKGPSGKDIFGDIGGAVKDAAQFAGIFHDDLLETNAKSAREFADALHDAAKDAVSLSTFTPKFPEAPKPPKRPEEGDRGRAPTPAFGQPGFKVGQPAEDIDKLRTPKGITAEQRNRFFDDMIGRKEDRVQDITSLRGQVAELREIEGLIQQRIDATKDITRRLNLEDELVRVRRQRKSVLEQIAEDQAEAARKAAEAAAKVREQAKKQADTLKRAASTISDAFADFARDRDKAVKKATSGTDGPLTKTHALNTKRILAGLGLSPADERELRSRLSVFNSAGRALGAAPGVAGGARSGRAPMFAIQAPDVFLDGQKVSTNTRRNNTVHARRNPKQKRGTRF